VFQDLLTVVIVALVASAIACRLIIWLGPVDHPNIPRKQHGQATRTSGGLGIGVGYAIAMAMLLNFSAVWQYEVSPHGERLLWMSAAFSFPLLIIGFVDDALDLPASLKFVLYSLISIAAALVIGPISTFPFGGDSVLVIPYLAAVFGTALWIFTLINCVNFMDGANGLAMGSVGFALVALAFISLAGGAPSGAAISLCGAGATLGFLIWNFPAGRLFAGDSGALFGGALGAFASLIVIIRTGASPFVPVIAFFPILADALITLVWRVWRRRSLFTGHVEHHYQLAIRGGLSREAVAVAYWLATIACGVLAFAVAREPDFAAEWIALLGLSLLAIILSAFTHNWARERGLIDP
jgi:UDP-GlcNAc:undecaprenyl-phosphate/decaprenyl-phosphate GlcNAc-1-phosphate transferase